MDVASARRHDRVPDFSHPRLVSDGRRLAWERHTEWPLTILALLFLVAYAWPILDPSLPPAAHLACDVVNFVAWGAFVIDYVVRLVLADRHRRFVATHLFDLAT